MLAVLQRTPQLIMPERGRIRATRIAMSTERFVDRPAAVRTNLPETIPETSRGLQDCAPVQIIKA